MEADLPVGLMSHLVGRFVRTAGMIPASHANLRDWVWEISAPVSKLAEARPPISVSTGMVTTTVAATPPALGRRSTG
jgi:hypothetical protein